MLRIEGFARAWVRDVSLAFSGLVIMQMECFIVCVGHRVLQAWRA